MSLPCASCGQSDLPVKVYAVRSRPGAPPLDEIFPPKVRGVVSNGECLVRLCDECSDIASVPLGTSYGAIAEPLFMIEYAVKL